MINNISRIGNITSSEGAVAVISESSRPMTDEEKEQYKKENPKGKKTTIISWPGQKCLTYIEECNMERRLGRALECDSNARALSWGKVFEILGLEYQLVSSDTIVHPLIPYWSGSPDANKFDEGSTVCDIKCPLTLKSFCTLVAPLYMKEVEGVCQYSGHNAINWIRENHTDGEKYYWQLVSNAVLTDSKYAELIVYAPYKSELQSIREFIQSLTDDQYKYYWINNANDDELPFLLDGGFYKNLNTIRFEVPQADKDLLTKRMIACKDLLINHK